jgi:hypothetical protein
VYWLALLQGSLGCAPALFILLYAVTPSTVLLYFCILSKKISFLHYFRPSLLLSTSQAGAKAVYITVCKRFVSVNALAALVNRAG